MHIPGLQSYSDPIQDSVAQIILLNFVRKMKSVPNPTSNAVKRMTLDAEIKLFHNQMKYPWGKIVMLERNSEKTDTQNHYYAIKDLTTVIKIMKKENMVRILMKTDPEFKILLKKAITMTNELLAELKTHEILGYSGLTASTFALYSARENNNFNVKLNLERCVKAIKMTWQNIWTKFKSARHAFEFVLHDLNSEFEIKLNTFQPISGNANIILLTISENENIMLWARLNGKTFKAKVTFNCPLEWVEKEQIKITNTPLWFLSAIEKRKFINDSPSEMDSELLDKFSSTACY